MRPIYLTAGCAAVVLLLAAAPASRAAGEGERGSAKDAKSSKKKPPRHLTSADISKVVAPFVGDIGECYKKHGLSSKKATGALRIELVIKADGRVKRSRIRAPGVKGKRLARCLSFVERLEFPPRRFYTAATLPFYYQRTGDGGKPVESCWDAKGCPDKRRKARDKRDKGEK